MTFNITIRNDGVTVAADDRTVTLHDPNPEALAEKLRAQIVEESPDSIVVVEHAASAERLLTTDETASRLNVSRDAVYDLIRAGDLPTVRIGVGKRQLHRIEPDALRAFVERNREVAS